MSIADVGAVLFGVALALYLGWGVYENYKRKKREDERRLRGGA